MLLSPGKSNSVFHKSNQLGKQLVFIPSSGKPKWVNFEFLYSSTYFNIILLQGKTNTNRKKLIYFKLMVNHYIDPKCLIETKHFDNNRWNKWKGIPLGTKRQWQQNQISVHPSPDPGLTISVLGPQEWIPVLIRIHTFSFMKMYLKTYSQSLLFLLGQCIKRLTNNPLHICSRVGISIPILLGPVPNVHFHTTE